MRPVPPPPSGAGPKSSNPPTKSAPAKAPGPPAKSAPGKPPAKTPAKTASAGVPSQVAPASAVAVAASEPAWQTVQRRTFTRWCNAALRVRLYELKDVVLDLEDGLALINLLELLSGEGIGSKFNRVPRHKAQKLENVMIALNFIKNKKIKIVAIGPEVKKKTQTCSFVF